MKFGPEVASGLYFQTLFVLIDLVFLDLRLINGM